jgi:hypothetical protein
VRAQLRRERPRDPDLAAAVLGLRWLDATADDRAADPDVRLATVEIEVAAL